MVLRFQQRTGETFALRKGGLHAKGSSASSLNLGSKALVLSPVVQAKVAEGILRGAMCVGTAWDPTLPSFTQGGLGTLPQAFTHTLGGGRPPLPRVRQERSRGQRPAAPHGRSPLRKRAASSLIHTDSFPGERCCSAFRAPMSRSASTALCETTLSP